jgi:hypothetical protein
MRFFFIDLLVIPKPDKQTNSSRSSCHLLVEVRTAGKFPVPRFDYRLMMPPEWGL